MGMNLQKLQEFLESDPCIIVEISGAKGSCPREKGTWMLVNSSNFIGTIGGGQLEYIGIDSARQMLRSGDKNHELDVPLGPEIGQCCGGRVALDLTRVNADIALNLMMRLEQEIEQLPHCYIMGAGHVGRALALAMMPLPFKTIVVDTRKEELEMLPSDVEARLTAMPEAVVRSAPAKSIFVILTHDHAMDFMIALEALSQRDAAYVGMIGSSTKRARYTSWAKEQGASSRQIDTLICPIGGDKLPDKRPEVIAALVAGEILVHTGMSPKQTLDSTENKRQFLGGN